MLLLFSDSYCFQTCDIFLENPVNISEPGTIRWEINDFQLEERILRNKLGLGQAQAPVGFPAEAELSFTVEFQILAFLGKTYYC